MSRSLSMQEQFQIIGSPLLTLGRKNYENTLKLTCQHSVSPDKPFSPCIVRPL